MAGHSTPVAAPPCPTQVQAQSHLEALSAEHSWANVRLWSRTRANAEVGAGGAALTGRGVPGVPVLARALIFPRDPRRPGVGRR